jgi:hypothetical protein
MFVQVIEGRYTVDHGILKSYLEGLFKDEEFKIIVSIDSYETIPPELTQQTSYQMKERSGKFKFHAN